MLFFTRAALCIGTIVVLAEGLGPFDLARSARETAGSLTPSTLESVASLCRSKPEACAGIETAAARIVQAEGMAAPEPPPRTRPAADRRGAGQRSDLSSRPPVSR